MRAVLWAPHQLRALHAVGDLLDEWMHHVHADFDKGPEELNGDAVTSREHRHQGIARGKSMEIRPQKPTYVPKTKR